MKSSGLRTENRVLFRTSPILKNNTRTGTEHKKMCSVQCSQTSSKVDSEVIMNWFFLVNQKHTEPCNQWGSSPEQITLVSWFFLEDQDYAAQPE